MKLGELMFSCYIFAKIDAGQYEVFRQQVESLKLVNDKDYPELLKLLNKYWKCRLPKSSLEGLGKKLKSWHEKYQSRLFPTRKVLSELDDNDLSLAAEAYGEILNCKFEYETKNQKPRSISLAPTVASKILFSLRPDALPPWDKSIREQLACKDVISNGSPQELYLSYLTHVRDVIHDLQETYGDTLRKWLQELGRPLPKLIDEYYWVTMTRKIYTPTKDLLQNWIKWY